MTLILMSFAKMRMVIVSYPFSAISAQNVFQKDMAIKVVRRALFSVGRLDLTSKASPAMLTLLD